ncbi:MAG: hypothetical protein JWM89_905 [Acidimicrobiales bacterium]|nr:hypothetical protein [Acidimicrobiales bacterium]
MSRRGFGAVSISWPSGRCVVVLLAEAVTLKADGWTYEQFGAHLEVSPSTVYRAIRRARRGLVETPGRATRPSESNDEGNRDNDQYGEEQNRSRKQDDFIRDDAAVTTSIEAKLVGVKSRLQP